MAIIITITLFILGMMLKKSKCIYCAEMIWIWILLSFCSDTQRADYANYLRAYERWGSSKLIITNSEIGYRVLNKILYTIGLEFEQAIVVMMLLVVILLVISIPKYTDSVAFVASLFMIYPLFIAGIQIRNTFVMAIMVFAIPYLREKTKISMMKYCVCVILAMSFQTTALIYFVLLLVHFVEKKNIKYFACIITFAMFYLPHMEIGILSKLFGEARYETRIVYVKNTVAEMIIAMIWQITCVFGIGYLHYCIKNNNNWNEKKLKWFSINDSIFRINIIMLIIIPLYGMDFSTERLFRNIAILNFAFVANCMQMERSSKRIDLIIGYIVLGMWYILTTVYFEGIYADNWNKLVQKYLLANDMIVHWSKHILLWEICILIVVSKIIFERNHIRVVWAKKKNV